MTEHVSKEHRVREIAYLLWERDGYPDGASDRHWFEAESLYEAEHAAPKAANGASPEDVAPAKFAAPPAKSTVAKPASKVAAKPLEPIMAASAARAPAAPKRKA